MRTWGFIGSGNIGSTLARLAVDAGDRVVMSNSRGPETLAGLITELGSGASAGTPAEAAAADIVVVTIPLRAYRSVPVDELRGKVVVDTMNYYPGRDGQIKQLGDGTAASSQMFQGFVRDAAVVKACNNIFYQHLAALARPREQERTALPIAGDSASAKEFVRGALGDLGYDTVDAGPLADSWRQQPGTPVYGTPYAADPDDWSADARRAGAAEIQEALAAARR